MGLKDTLEALGVDYNELIEQRPEAILRALCGEPEALVGAVDDVTITSTQAAEAQQAQQPLYCIWAEENGPLGANAYEWSWGNGATGNDIGIPIAFRSQLVAISFNADQAGTSVTMRTQRNIVDVYTSTHSTRNSYVTLPTPIIYEPGDVLAFRTGTVSGAWTDARICAWLRESPA